MALISCQKNSCSAYGAGDEMVIVMACTLHGIMSSPCQFALDGFAAQCTATQCELRKGQQLAGRANKAVACGTGNNDSSLPGWLICDSSPWCMSWTDFSRLGWFVVRIHHAFNCRDGGTHVRMVGFRGYVYAIEAIWGGTRLLFYESHSCS